MNIRWAVQFRSDNRLDGRTRRIIWKAGEPLLFFTRAAARAWVKEHLDYIGKRPDLRREPHGWKVPRVVRVTVDIKEFKG